MYPSDLRYTKEHEWVRLQGNIATVGITDYAQQELGDVVFVELPKVGAKLLAGKIVRHRRIRQSRQRNLLPRLRRSHRSEFSPQPTRLKPSTRTRTARPG